MESNEDSESSDSEYDTADEDLDIYFEKIVDLYINKKSEIENVLGVNFMNCVWIVRMMKQKKLKKWQMK